MGTWSLDAAQFPTIPATLRLRLSPSGQKGPVSAGGGHLTSHVTFERRAEAYDAEGNGLSAFDSWRAANKRSFSVTVPPLQLGYAEFGSGRDVIRHAPLDVARLGVVETLG